MRKIFKYILIFSFLLSFLFSSQDVFAQAGGGGDQKLQPASDLVKEHLEKVKSQFQSHESYGRQVAQKIQGGAKEHPWTEQGNPTSAWDWQFDSFLMKEMLPMNALNWNNIHGCFEFGLLGHAYTSDGRDYVGTEPEGLGCQLYCLVASLPTIHAPWFLNDNGSETAHYWFPEYEVYTNNYAINRLKPDELGQDLFRPQRLRSDKMQIDEEKKNAAGQTYKYDASSFQVPSYLQQKPYFGQGHSSNQTFADDEGKLYGHVARTHFSVTRSDEKIHTREGWETPIGRIKSVLDSFPKKSNEHAPINIWTEYQMWDLFTSIPHFSTRIYGNQGKKFMNALNGGRTDKIKQASAEESPFWKNTGAMAYRVKTWPNTFRPLQNLYQINGGEDLLKEIVYKGGHELYPLVTKVPDFGSPTLSTAAIIARRTLYLAGENQTMKPYFPKNVPDPRIAQYTINSQRKELEIDKMQLIFPRQAGNLKTSECFRSQSIPNLTNSDKSLNQWRDQNMPSDLTKFALDPALWSIQGGDSTFGYWNRRISCHCRFVGITTASFTMNDGDNLYDRPKIPLCTYPLGYTFSAWAGKDTYPYCKVPFTQFKRFRGMDDEKSVQDN